MTRECLNRRIPGIDALRNELKKWNESYNTDPSPINWQFQTKDSRIKLKRLYPNIDKQYQLRDNRRKMKSKDSPSETPEMC